MSKPQVKSSQTYHETRFVIAGSPEAAPSYLERGGSTKADAEAWLKRCRKVAPKQYKDWQLYEVTINVQEVE